MIIEKRKIGGWGGKRKGQRVIGLCDQIAHNMDVDK